MKVYLIGTKTIRINRADAYVYMQLCSVMAHMGIDVSLLTPIVRGVGEGKTMEDIWACYGLMPSFSIIETPCYYDEKGLPNIRRIKKYVSTLRYFLHLESKKLIGSNDIVMSFCLASAMALVHLKRIGLLRAKILFMNTEYKAGRIASFVNNHADVLVVFGDYIYRKLLESGINKDRIFLGKYITYPDELRKYSSNNNREILERFGISGKKVITYAGKVGLALQEVNNIIDAVTALNEDVALVIVGARKETGAYAYYTEYLKSRSIENVIICDYLSIPDYMHMMFASDILVSYSPANNEFNMFNRKPAKAGPHLCAGKPLIFADLPTLREFLPDEAVFFVEPDNPEKLSEKIEYILNNPDEAKRKAAKCLEVAERYSAKNVVKEMLDFCANA